MSKIGSDFDCILFFLILLTGENFKKLINKISKKKLQLKYYLEKVTYLERCHIISHT